jgi:hypothetical protein
MTKIKTSELIGAALDWAVAKCEGLLERGSAPLGAAVCKISGDRVILTFCARDDNEYEPSTYWSQGGPIVEREGINLLKVGIKNWRATMDYGSNGSPVFHDVNPLIVAMRCYVASKLGDEVEIPEELR